MKTIFFLLLIPGFLFAQSAAEIEQIFNSMTLEEQEALFEKASQYKFTVEEMNESAEELGVEPNSRHIRRMMGQLPERKYDTDKLQIAKHLKGKNGIPFPGVDTINAAYPEYQIDSQEVKKYISNKYLPDLERSYQEGIQAIDFPDCTQDNTFSEKIGNVNSRQQDILFIRAENVPDNIEEAFGRSVSLRPYYRDKMIGIHHAALGLGVICLPTRFRIASGYYFIDQGKNALKNYSKNYP